MENIVKLDIKDKDLEFKTYTVYVKYDNEKYKELEKLCTTYNDFQEIIDFIENNFEIVEIETLELEI